MNVLVVNAGSSSLKYQLLDTDTREVFAKGNCERIGSDMGIFGHSENGGAKQTEEVPFPDHRSAIARVLEELEKTDFTIDGIGHRIVQGGWYFDDSAVVDDEVMAKILEVAPLAPLHNYGSGNRVLSREVSGAAQRGRLRHLVPHDYARGRLHLRPAQGRV